MSKVYYIDGTYNKISNNLKHKFDFIFNSTELNLLEKKISSLKNDKCLIYLDNLNISSNILETNKLLKKNIKTIFILSNLNKIKELKKIYEDDIFIILNKKNIELEEKLKDNNINFISYEILKQINVNSLNELLLKYINVNFNVFIENDNYDYYSKIFNSLSNNFRNLNKIIVHCSNFQKLNIQCGKNILKNIIKLNNSNKTESDKLEFLICKKINNISKKSSEWKILPSNKLTKKLINYKNKELELFDFNFTYLIKVSSVSEQILLRNKKSNRKLNDIDFNNLINKII